MVRAPFKSRRPLQFLPPKGRREHSVRRQEAIPDNSLDMPKQQVNFHIGLEKTGTTSFQWFCTQRQDVLLRHSLLYPTRNLAFDRYNHQYLVDSYLDERQLGHQPVRPRPHVLASLRAEMASARADRILIAGEFSSLFDDGQIASLAADFADFDCRISVTVREHHARLVSAYRTACLLYTSDAADD